jgi:hypothetical protein
VISRYFQDLERGRTMGAGALIASDLRNPQPTLAGPPALGLSTDPGYWKGVRLDSASQLPRLGGGADLYAPYHDCVRVVAHLRQVYREGQSNDYPAGEPVDIYFTLGRETPSSPWRIVDMQDNGV